MYAEYIYSDRQYETIEKNIKAYLFDIITKEQHKMAEISNKLVSEESPELQEQIKELYMENDKCISSLLTLSADLSDVIKKLDMVARKYTFMEDKDTPQLVANISLNDENEKGIVSDVNNVTDDTSIEKKNDDNNEAVVGSDFVIPTVTNTNNTEGNTTQDGTSIDNASSVGVDVPAIGNIITTPNESQDTSSEDNSTSSNVEINPVAPIATSNPEVPQIISNVDTSIDDSEKQLVFAKEDVNPAKAILTTGNQVSKLRESREAQSALLIAEGFFNLNENKTEASSDEVIQVAAAGLLDQNQQQSTQQQIEQLMTQANELYQAGNVVESQKLYDQISQLNQTLKES